MPVWLDHFVGGTLLENKWLSITQAMRYVKYDITIISHLDFDI